MVFTDEQVEAIYQEYPRKVVKPAALKAIRAALARLVKRNGRSDIIGWLRERTRLYGAFRRKEWAMGRDADKGFTPHPATWFNGDRFDDEIPVVTTIAQDKWAVLNADRKIERERELEAAEKSRAEGAEFDAWWAALSDSGRAGFVRDVETVDAKFAHMWGDRDPMTSRLFRCSCVVLWKRRIKGRHVESHGLFDNGQIPF